MTYQDSLDFLFPLHRFGIKPGLETITQLCKKIGKPEDRLGKVIHIAGTNGKGSTASMIASICQEAGFKTGLYTSPHLSDFKERIRINGEKISEEKVAFLTEQLKDKAIELQATFFEVTTAMAFKHFAEENVEISVIEVGLGGKYDATNIVSPFISVITPIGFDHMEQLGDSLEKIASEKAGIIKHNTPVVISTQNLEALEVLFRTAKERKSKAILSSAVTGVSISHESLEKLRFHISWNKGGVHDGGYYGLEVPFIGHFQAENARVSVIVAELLKIEEAAIRLGLQNVKKNTGHRARLELLRKNPYIMLDVSHNEHGIEHSLQTLYNHRHQFNRVIVIFGAMKDKEPIKMIKHLSYFANEIHFVVPKVTRALTDDELKSLLSQDELSEQTISPDKIKFSGGVSDAVRNASAAAIENDLILITGSFYVASEVLEMPEYSELNSEINSFTEEEKSH
ncbi:MAG: folylpolyglutamate synthase/dihydrofolate synthase family protein [Chloroherpetonaceae bacterium]|nr:folylpolyglutamate synthase/dihydrofolate synthase family protein [Chloroherpetonaceae bacterium]